MAAILPSQHIDCDKNASRYFLPYQMAWIADDSQMRLVDKSVRIGWTYCDAFKNVRKRLRNKKRDYLFTTKDQPTAFEYITTCYQFCQIFDFTKSILSHGIEEYRAPVLKNGKETGFTEEVKVGVIKFDNGSRIISFSSNPNALRAYGGDVGLDEFAFHPAAKELWMSAQGRVTWGFDIGVWSSSNGLGSLHYSLSREAQAGKGGWSYYRITMEDAVELGLVDKINQVSGHNMSPAEFIADCKNRARFEEIYQADYMCNPRGGTSTIVPWSAIERCQAEHNIPFERLHLEAEEITRQFGPYALSSHPQRQQNITSYLRSSFPSLLSSRGKFALGFDVAASGNGDLCVIYIDALPGRNLHQLAALFTCRTEDWAFIKTVLHFFMRQLNTVVGCGDETGLGRQICWEAAGEFQDRFTPINFSSSKSDLGFLLMNQLDAAQKQIPGDTDNADIAADYYALSKHYIGKRWVFTESQNLHNPTSHCDIAWAGALASEAAKHGTPTGTITSTDHILLGKPRLSLPRKTQEHLS